MAHSILATIVTLGLLASGDACVWLCQAAAVASTADIVAESHCANVSGGHGPGTSGSAAELPGSGAPSHEDCPGCALDVAAMPSPLVASVATVTHTFAFAVPSTAPGLHGAMLRSGHGPLGADRFPPRDVLSITSSLRL